MALVVGGVEVPDVVIHTGAKCNAMGQQTWEMLKLNGVKCELRKSARDVFAYGGTKLLQPLGTFTEDVMLVEGNTHSRADYMVVKGSGRKHVGPSQENSERNTRSCLRLLVC